MSLAEDLDGIRNKRRGPVPCTTAVWIASLSESDQVLMRTAIAEGVETRFLHHVAVRHGCAASETQFRVHCKQRCTCYRGMEVAA